MSAPALGTVEGMSNQGETRTEHDSMGDIEVPKDALWRAQTQRAVENFPISGTTLEPSHIVAIARVKKAAARINAELGIISEEQADGDRPGRRRDHRAASTTTSSPSTSSRPARAPAPT